LYWTRGKALKIGQKRTMTRRRHGCEIRATLDSFETSYLGRTWCHNVKQQQGKKDESGMKQAVGKLTCYFGRKRQPQLVACDRVIDGLIAFPFLWDEK
jgi:hypothetical protein